MKTTCGMQPKHYRGKFIALNMDIIKEANQSKINDLRLHLRKLEQKEQYKPNSSKNEIIKIEQKSI